MLSDNDFLEVINFIGSQEKKARSNFIPLETLEDPLSATELDSLGVMMFYVLLDEFFGIPDESIEEGDTVSSKTGKDILKFVLTHQTKGFTIEELQETFKQYK
jgi:acyl carrier protein